LRASRNEEKRKGPCAGASNTAPKMERVRSEKKKKKKNMSWATVGKPSKRGRIGIQLSQEPRTFLGQGKNEKKKGEKKNNCGPTGFKRGRSGPGGSVRDAFFCFSLKKRKRGGGLVKKKDTRIINF